MLLPMILLIVLIGCRATETLTIDIPPLEHTYTRPVLEPIGNDTVSALKSLTNNMGLLSEYAENLEIFIRIQNEYYTNIISIITR